MCRLFETIRVINGVPQHLSWHEARMNHARKEIWKSDIPIILGQLITVPPELSSGPVRCNILYGPEIQQVIFKKYEKRNIRSLKLVSCNDIDYHFKYTDRSVLEELLAFRGAYDEIIVVKNGMITDTTLSNLIFYDGRNWFTPSKPLLKGTCRNRLLAMGSLIEQDIRPGDLKKFTGCKLINALRDPDEELLIPVSEISQKPLIL
jgi:4-amino-4-deoxychorismate lyase